ncbi:MAG TPA: pyridoxamine 5'-phosphate oxidase family protein, partial [Roseiflexaceae bacterium]
ARRRSPASPTLLASTGRPAPRASMTASMSEDSGGPLSPAELDEFLAQPLLLKVACVRPDGWPYVVPLWFAWHEQKLYVVARQRAVWIAFIRREPRVGVAHR